jgi:S1-C subfamily serine protease
MDPGAGNFDDDNGGGGAVAPPLAAPSIGGADPMDADGAAAGAAAAAAPRRPVSPPPGSAAAAAAAAANAPRPTAAAAAALRSVVKIFVTRIDPNYGLPWQKSPQRAATGSGFVVDVSEFQPIENEQGQVEAEEGGGGAGGGGKQRSASPPRLMILTNAHVINNAVTIYVRRPGSAKKFAATAACVARQCDLALLSVSDPAFWGVAAAAGGTGGAAATTSSLASLPPLQPLHFAARVPHVQEALVVAGYPTGGDALSLTSGIVSRVAMVRYSAYGRLIGVQS